MHFLLSQSWTGPRQRFGVRVPLGPLPSSHKVVTITTASHPIPFPTDLAHNPYRPDHGAVLEEPSLAYFCDAATPTSLPALAEKQAPLTSIHLSTFEDCLAVGFTVPHGVFDGKGMQILLGALQAELHGTEWTAPPLDTVNRVVRGVDELIEATEDDPAASLATGQAAGGALSHMTTITDHWNLAKFLFSKLLVERVLYSGEVKSAFLGRDLIADIVREAKEEVAAQGKGEYVSTQDVVSMWFLRAACKDEVENGSRNDIAFSGVFCYRQLLTDNTSVDLSLYPHNSVFAYPMTPTTSVADFVNRPISEVASSHRRAILRARTPSYLASLMRFIKEFNFKSLIPRQSYGTDAWFLTNQIEANLPSIVDWSAIVPGLPEGSKEGYGVFNEWTSPRPMDHFDILNEVEGGWLWSGGMRKGRWASLEKELKRLERRLEDSRPSIADSGFGSSESECSSPRG